MNLKTETSKGGYEDHTLHTEGSKKEPVMRGTLYPEEEDNDGEEEEEEMYEEDKIEEKAGYEDDDFYDEEY